MSDARVTLRSASVALAAYALIALAMTWPLALGLSQQIPQDLGDPLLNCWILGWDLDHLARFVGGEWNALSGLWDANIFHPAPFALAYSEHLLAQSVQALPVYLLTRDIVLCYNLLFLSTFILSALGAYLWVRDLTGDPRAAFLAGLIFGFIPYRIDQLGHLQVLSSQWMPLALFALRRFFATRSRTAWVGAALALVAQNLSCGYYIFFFSPFVAVYALWEMATRDRLRDLRTWTAMLLLAGLVLAATLPFLLPYAAVRASGGIVREIDEVKTFSADVLSYLTADSALRVWGDRVHLYSKTEGDLFPGFLPILLALVGLAIEGTRLWRGGGRALDARPLGGESHWRGLVAAALMAIAAVSGGWAFLVIAGGPHVLRLGSLAVTTHSPARALGMAALAMALAALSSARLRSGLRAAARSPHAFCAIAALVAVWLSLGPTIHAFGVETTQLGLYRIPYRWVPGFDGLRVPARFAMVAFVFLAALAGLAANALLKGRHALWVPLVSIGLLAEATAAPIHTHFIENDGRPRGRADAVVPPPPIYEYVKALPRDTVLAEFPFGEPGDEARYVFYSTTHWRRLINGYSGGSPRSYSRRHASLSRPLARPQDAWQALVEAGTTHVIVHEGAWHFGKGPRVTAWLESHGARRLATAEQDVLIALPRR